MKVAIIGAGIIGLGVGVNVLETYPDAMVTIYTEKTTPFTTGDVAAGLFYPYALTRTDTRIEKWCRTSWEFFNHLIQTDPNHPEYGVFYQDLYELSENSPMKMYYIHEVFGNSRHLNEVELRRFPNAKYGIASTTVMCEGRKILSHLMERFLSKGGRIEICYVEDIDDVQMLQDYPVVINCTGVAAGKLCNDSEVYPIRGQIVKVEAPWFKYCIDMGRNYILPQSDGSVVLGGTKQIGNWNLSPNKFDTEDILSGCFRIVPGLKNSRIIATKVGLRPGRKSIRLEIEKKMNKKTEKEYNVIHNYGHGGSGLTLFWGCAVNVTALLTELITKAKL